jgi:hypothetical protein
LPPDCFSCEPPDAAPCPELLPSPSGSQLQRVSSLSIFDMRAVVDVALAVPLLQGTGDYAKSAYRLMCARAELSARVEEERRVKASLSNTLQQHAIAMKEAKQAEQV